MTVNEYIEELTESIAAVMNLCRMGSVNGPNPCKGCLLSKNAGKPCPLGQLLDVKTALRYAVVHNMSGITGDTSVDKPEVVLYMRRVVVDGYSVRTLRACSEDYIKGMSLVPIESFLPECSEPEGEVGE